MLVKDILSESLDGHSLYPSKRKANMTLAKTASLKESIVDLHFVKKIRSSVKSHAKEISHGGYDIMWQFTRPYKAAPLINSFAKLENMRPSSKIWGKTVSGFKTYVLHVKGVSRGDTTISFMLNEDGTLNSISVLVSLSNHD